MFVQTRGTVGGNQENREKLENTMNYPEMTNPNQEIERQIKNTQPNQEIQEDQENTMKHQEKTTGNQGIKLEIKKSSIPALCQWESGS